MFIDLGIELAATPVYAGAGAQAKRKLARFALSRTIERFSGCGLWTTLWDWQQNDDRGWSVQATSDGGFTIPRSALDGPGGGVWQWIVPLRLDPRRGARQWLRAPIKERSEFIKGRQAP